MAGHMHDVGLKLQAVVDMGNVADLDRSAIHSWVAKTMPE